MYGFKARSAHSIQINHADSPVHGNNSWHNFGGRLAASVMIFNTVWYTHKRAERRRKSCYFNEQRAKSVLSIAGCGQTFNPVGLSCQDEGHSRHGGFPTNISHPWPPGATLTQKEATGVYFALFDGGYRQAAMFVFPDWRNKETVGDKKKGRQVKRRREPKRERKKNTGKEKIDVLSCHLFPIGEVVRHSTAGSTGVLQTEGIKENQWRTEYTDNCSSVEGGT